MYLVNGTFGSTKTDKLAEPGPHMERVGNKFAAALQLLVERLYMNYNM